MIQGWPLRQELHETGMTWEQHLVNQGWKGTGVPGTTVFIFDEAQMTYEDHRLWNYLRLEQQHFERHLVENLSQYQETVSQAVRRMRLQVSLRLG